MGICVYCDKEKTLTKEHVFPNYLEKKIESESLYYSGSAKKYIANAPVVKDVCANCNNVKLGSIDAYSASLYDKYFKHEILSTVSIQYDHELFVRWLLKVLFNAQRSFKGEYKAFLPYKKYMLGDDTSPQKIYLLGGVIKAGTHDGNTFQARDIRVSDIRLPELKLGIQFSVCHAVTIRSYSFLVLSFIKEPSKKAFQRTIKFIKDKLGYELSKHKGELKFNPSVSKMDHVTHKGHQKFNNPNVFPDNGLIQVGKKQLQLTNFPSIPAPTKDSKMFITTVIDDSHMPLLGLENVSDELKDFSVGLSENIYENLKSVRAVASVLRKGEKTYVTIHDLVEPKLPFLTPSTGILQTTENWNYWKKGLEENNCLYLCSSTDFKNIKKIIVYSIIPITDIKEEV